MKLQLSRTSLLVSGAAATIGGAAIAARSQQVIRACFAVESCSVPPPSYSLLSNGAMLAAFVGAVAFAWALPLGARPTRRLASAAALGLVLAALTFIPLLGGGSCTTTGGDISADGAVLTPSTTTCGSNVVFGLPAEFLGWLGFSVVLFALAFAMRAVLLPAAGSPQRVWRLRVAIGAIGMVLLVPSLFVIGTWVGADHLQVAQRGPGGEGCSSGPLAPGSAPVTITCVPVSQLVLLPLSAMSGGFALCRGWNVGARWSGWVAFATAAVATALVVGMNVGSTGRLDPVGPAAAAIGLGVVCALLGQKAGSSPEEPEDPASIA